MNITLKKLNKTYKRVNPSTYFEKIEKKNIVELEKQRKNLFHNKLNFPIELFKNKKLLDLGSGTGLYSVIYNLWGSDCTLIEYDSHSFKKSKEIFEKFGRQNSQNNFKNIDLFNFKGKFTLDKRRVLYDIVHCNGVLHHTSKKELGIKLMAENLKSGGVLILGASIVTGFLQRNLQRYLLYKISKNEKEIVKNAKKYFKKHLMRASKISGRSIKAIIFDTYINHKIDSYSLNSLMEIFKKNKISFYSSFPKINSIDDEEMEWKNDKENYPKNESLNFTNLIWGSRNQSKKNKKFETFSDELLEISKSFNDISYRNTKTISSKITKLKKNINNIIKKNKKEIPHVSKMHIYFSEINTLLKILNNREVIKLEKFIFNTKYLFKGYSGLGMNYFIGFKK
ncbi:MAG: hypothetical protein CMI75_06530 [Candidatus Pelagibacter sp.]|nr:hypothetical protein [Candidatus Pelagibacter sp.]OUT95730.1 MAG: hypothetical protein CBB96_03195 [Gammaproteobacteria bacterium TMED36]|tara:strand:- start:494 stop:1681 length:1188 start_codon:yes stop_codon:yes gene_type:complete